MTQRKHVGEDEPGDRPFATKIDALNFLRDEFPYWIKTVNIYSVAGGEMLDKIRDGLGPDAYYFRNGKRKWFVADPDGLWHHTFGDLAFRDVEGVTYARLMLDPTDILTSGESWPD